jgi:hypothetical protein
MNKFIKVVFNNLLINRKLFLIILSLSIFTSSCNLFNSNYLSFDLCFDIKQNKFHHTIETGFLNQYCISTIKNRTNYSRRRNYEEKNISLDSCLSCDMYDIVNDTLFINSAYMGREGFYNDFSDDKSSGVIIINRKRCKPIHPLKSNSEYFMIQEFKDLTYDEIVKKISTIKVQYAIFNNESYNYNRDTIIKYFKLKKCCE